MGDCPPQDSRQIPTEPAATKDLRARAGDDLTDHEIRMVQLSAALP